MIPVVSGTGVAFCLYIKTSSFRQKAADKSEVFQPLAGTLLATTNEEST